MWLCRVHNLVNMRIGKPQFNCDLVAARWAPLDCAEDEGSTGCDLAGVGAKAWAGKHKAS